MANESGDRKLGIRVSRGKRAVRPSRDDLARHLEASTAALARAAKAFIKPGVKLRRVKDIPLYSVDPDHPHILIRELNGRRQRGVLVGSEFKPTE
jgi:hypothetical protein